MNVLEDLLHGATVHEQRIDELEDLVVKPTASQAIIQASLRALLLIGGGSEDIRSGVKAGLLALQIETAAMSNPSFRARLDTDLGMFWLEMLPAQNGS